MVYHFIAIVSGYVAGKRIAWHYASTEKLDKEKIALFIEEAKKRNIDQFGMHKLSTDSYDWESVIEKDSYFEDVYATEDDTVFFDMLVGDQEISAIDIAKLFLSIKSFSQLKIQKLVYLAYADYLCKYQRTMFREDVVAYPYGPVVESVYQEFKKYGADDIEVEENYSYKISEKKLPPLFMKILSSEHGMEILDSAFRVILKFKTTTASELVELTHSPESPWTMTYEGPYTNRVITDETIINYHKNEVKHY